MVTEPPPGIAWTAFRKAEALLKNKRKSVGMKRN